MAEKENMGQTKATNPDPDLRFKYLGFEVKPGKIGSLFSSDSEKENWVSRVLEKRKKGPKLREKCTLEEPRVAPYERIVLTVTSLLLVLSLFLPWFSGYKETVVQKSPQEQIEAAAPAGETDSDGFASVGVARQTKEIRREYHSLSALGALISIGDVGGKVFSSGLALMLTGLLFIVYMLACIWLAFTTLKTLYKAKGSEDDKALALRKVLKWNWIPIGIWVLGMILAVMGASYSFSTAGAIAQIGTSYGIGAYLGILSFGFYISLGAAIMNAVKAFEI